MVCGARQRSRPFINYVTLHMNIVRHYVTAQYSIVRARYRLQSLAFALHVLFFSNMFVYLGERGVAVRLRHGNGLSVFVPPAFEPR